MATLPPWLDVNPQQFTQASEEGLRLGQAARAETAQEGQAQQGFDIQRQGQANQFADAQGQQHLQAEQQAAQQAEAQARLKLEMQTAAQKSQAQLGYQQAVQSGMDPVQAMMKFGPLMGEPMSGLGQIALSNYRMHQASLPPAALMGPDGKVAGYSYNGSLRMMPKATVPKALDEGQKILAAHYVSELKDVAKETTANATMPDAGTARSLMNRKQQAIEGLKKLGIDVDGTGAQKQTANQPAADQPSTDSTQDNSDQKAPQVGEVIQGYEFLGGDPSDRQNWQPANE